MTNNKQNPKTMTKEDLGKAYEKVVGYDITEDDVNITEKEIVEIMKGYDALDEVEGTPFKNLGCY